MGQDLLGFYPQWYVPNFGSGYVVAAIASTHVLFSHISVGASFLLAYLLYKAYKGNHEEIYAYVKRYFLVLLLTSYIVGSLTGPGIWFSTTVSNPRGISALIHNFVWAWAAEWVWFVTEVALVYIIYYIFDKIDRRTLMHISWVFAVVSWGTLLLIVGILSFMMSPGSEKWFHTGNIMDSFYNPNYFPQVAVRTSFTVALAALMGLAIATRMRESKLRQELVREVSLIGIGGLLLAGMSMIWYLETLPDRAKTTLDFAIPEAFKNTIFISIILVALVFAFFYALPKANRSLAFLALLMVVVLGLTIFPQERIREWLRKPYIAGDYLYVNQIVARDVPAKGVKSEIPFIDEHGFLKVHPFVPASAKTVTPENMLEAGRAMAMISCAHCHSLDPAGPRPLVQKLEQVSTRPDVIYQFIERRLSGDPHQGAAPYMPQIAGTDEEIRALAAYLADITKQYVESKRATEQAAR
ncbi:MAG: cytochrome ubiquinol oxidase subunit I [Hydrogenibacillus schlegelii]|uniref:Cytochrome C553 (Soluble cytochrome f) n=1 Tax=Hydrogenibacillus schlegelii TaxID=1484 RepID=A0A2T5G6Z3_HYDSH|nr:cytochrome ubiquinol oxidase subunit I [Hydrogenibacillus schlegelii]MBT9281150.1 cytochrome ubiquinol oxidase subunit I [Hydrogenibacillus schlegelii]PTQ51932.1 MAG: Cytochrome C553 (soluble cytochrome f) [Hydrogenibacillus schlegelii]